MADIVARALALGAQDGADLANQRLDNLPNGIVYRGAVDYRYELDNITAEIGDAYTVKYKGTSGTDPLDLEYIYGEYDGQNTWIEFGKNYDDDIEKINEDLTKKQDVLSSENAGAGIDITPDPETGDIIISGVPITATDVIINN